MSEIQQRINKNSFIETLKIKNVTQASLSAKLGVNEKSFSRWINDGYIQSRYLLDLADELDLNEDEMRSILMIPKFRVFFRKKYLGEVPLEIEERATELARTLFGMTYLNSDSRFCPPNVSKLESETEVANQIRRYTKIDTFKNLQGIMSSLAEQGLEVALVPFVKLGLNSEGEYESAFSVTDEKRCLIFLDSDSQEELLIFNLCHEICHLFRPDLEFSKAEEKFCNAVASELIYPIAFFEVHKTTIHNIIGTRSTESIINLLHVIHENLGGEMFGIAIRLKSLGFFSQKDPLHQRIIGYTKNLSDQLDKVGKTLFTAFVQTDRKAFTDFWESDDLKKNPLLRFFFLLKNSATSGSLSPRKFSELMRVNIGISDELIHNWKRSLKESLKDE